MCKSFIEKKTFKIKIEMMKSSQGGGENVNITGSRKSMYNGPDLGIILRSMN
jgi:protein subunit release factor A